MLNSNEIQVEKPDNMNEDREGQRKAGGQDETWRWRAQWKERGVSQVEEERARWRQRERDMKGGHAVPSRAFMRGDQVTCGEQNGD